MSKEYENKHLVERADKTAEIILKSKGHTYVRDKFFPKMIDILELERGAEIGVDTAGFSDHLLGKSELEVLYCIDPWIDDFGSDHRPGFFDKNGSNRYEAALLWPYSHLYLSYACFLPPCAYFWPLPASYELPCLYPP